jgi:hypothetical protein
VENKNRPYLIKLFKGEISLVMTYWFWFVAICLALSLAFEYYYSHHLQPNYITYSVALLVMVYTFFILIAVYKSASKYQGWKGWRILAKAIVIINVSFLVYEGFEVLFSSKNEHDTLTAQIEKLNQRLPMNINKETQLIHAHIQTNKIYYDFQLNNVNFKSASRFNKRYFKEQMKKNICQDKNVKNILKKKYTLVYNYLDKFKTKIAQITADENICKKVFADEQLLQQILEAKI